MTTNLNPVGGIGAYPGTLISVIITWIRRIIKSPSDQSITDATIGDYLNRFYIYDMPERLQLFEMKRQYTFETIPNHFEYQFPWQNYQGIIPPAYCDGVQIGFYQRNDQFYNLYPELVNNQSLAIGNGTNGPYTIHCLSHPILRGFTDDLGNLEPYVFITALDGSGNQLYIVDDGYGILNQTDETFQTIIVANAGTVDYIHGTTTFSFNTLIPAGRKINIQVSPYSAGVPRIMLFFNNIIKLYPVPDRAYKIQADAYITPAQFMDTTDSLVFSYMAEYIARGAAQKILSDNADYDQFQFYERLFREQECLVLRRTERQNSVVRTPTIFSQTSGMNPYLYTQY